MTEATQRQLTPEGFTGTLLYSGDKSYDEARRVFNGMIDRSPAVIARCVSGADVAAAIRLARREGLSLSIYGGGHGVTGSAVCDAGVCVDLRGMKGVEVNPEKATVRAEAGLTWGELDAATQKHGLGVTGGRVSGTGIGGLTLGSGSGWLERKLGFTCDNLVSAEVVAADGRQIVASEDENPDLFWGLRGGGGNFGVVTAFHFRLHPVGPIVLGGILVYPATAGKELVRFYRDFMASAPDEIGGGLAFITAPPADFVPEPVRGHPVIAIICCYAGDVGDGVEALAPLRQFGPPAVDLVQPMPYLAVQQLLDPGNPEGMQNYWTADFLAELPDAAVDVLIEQTASPVSPLTQVVLLPGGGAIARVDEDATAFGQRDAPWNVHFLSMWPDPADDDANITWTRNIAAAMRPWTTGRAYLNFIGDEGPGRVEAAFGPAKFQRLSELKRAWDPENIFRHNQNIPPAP